jgi:type III secretory pathway lipoprotein EscJ
MTFSLLACVGLVATFGGALVPSVEDERIERERTVAAEVGKTLELVPGVIAARVHVRLAERGLLARSAAETGATAVVRVRGTGPPDAAMLRDVVAAAVPGASPEEVRVFVVREEDAAGALVRVGPLEVSRATAGMTRAVLIIALVAIVVLAAGLIAAGIRLRRLRRESGYGPGGGVGSG